jgi:hypothetical protein
MSKQSDPVIKIDRSGKDRLIPVDFMEILTQRLLPVLSLTYISTVVAIAEQKGDPMRYIFHDKTAYIMALMVALWVSIPAILWIFLRASHLYENYAGLWYKICTLIMIISLGLVSLLFPEADFLNLRFYFFATIPVFVILYFLFVKGGLPPLAAHPLTALGTTFLIYGATINIFH